MFTPSTAPSDLHPAHVFVNEWCVPEDPPPPHDSEVERMVLWSEMIPTPAFAQAG